MKKIMILAIIIGLCTTANCQNEKKTFVRVFDQHGKKFHKGFLLNTSDSSITITQNNNTVEIPINRINEIKLRHSFGHTVIITTVAVGLISAILFATAADPSAEFFAYTVGEGLIGGFAIGSLAGLTLGSLISAAIHRPAYLVNGDPAKWLKVKKILEPNLPHDNN